MDCKKILILLMILICTKSSFSGIIYKKNDVIITDIDLKYYKQLYENNYDTKIDDNNALKDLVLINNLINHIEKQNKEFLNQIDSQILAQYGKESLENISFRDFLRFSKIRDEFIINYFNNTLTVDEIINEFGKLDSLKLPLSINDCMIIDRTVDLKNNNNFVKILLQNLKNNSRDFRILLNGIEYQICIDENNFKSLERLIIKYIETQTNEDFKVFVYGKTKN